eukprot:TRINITY_DN17885_c0_g1_i1.p1 TRINITY_DN17885_c0_g1~~TRINITY_DN17885_c0_g1_i1.p1  ORF type:complete len:131 (+),score=24.53 TRINITY_DN17885_c0_g1_i1:236-628(+)
MAYSKNLLLIATFLLLPSAVDSLTRREAQAEAAKIEKQKSDKIIFDNADSNKDGLLSKGELLPWFQRAWRLSDEKAQKKMDRFLSQSDKDDNDMISMEEFYDLTKNMKPDKPPLSWIIKDATKLDGAVMV